MEDEGIVFKTGVHIGEEVKAQTLIDGNDAVLFACGSTWPRDLPIPGKHVVKMKSSIVLRPLFHHIPSPSMFPPFTMSSYKRSL